MRNNSSSARFNKDFLTHQFDIEIDNVVAGSFQEVSGLSAQMEVTEIKEGGLNTHAHKVVVRASYGDITLKRGFVNNPFLFAWTQAIALSTWTPRLNGAIVMWAYDPDDPDDVIGSKEIARWNFFRAFPSKWDGPTFNSNSSAIAVEAITLSCEWITQVIS
jgi:phage tail-like protein